MIYTRRILFITALLLATTVSACASNSGSVTTSDEESGIVLDLDETYDTVRNGARLVLDYNAESNSFVGFVENTTESPLKQVRVEVHLSNGVELGPTTPTDLNPGERIAVNLKATDSDFDGWTAHPEVGESGSGEHGNDEGEGEHNEGGSD
jgi:hypothetical protein